MNPSTRVHDVRAPIPTGTESVARLDGRIRAALLSDCHVAERDRIVNLAPRLVLHCDAAELVAIQRDHVAVVARTRAAATRRTLPSEALAGAGDEVAPLPSAVLPGFAVALWVPVATRATGVGLILHSRPAVPITQQDRHAIEVVRGLARTLATKLALLDEVANLRAALTSNRRIGIAIGIIVERWRTTADEAFDVLRKISQVEGKKLRDVADTLIVTGHLPELARPESSREDELAAR